MVEVEYEQPDLYLLMDEQSEGLPSKIVLRSSNEDNPNQWVYTLKRSEPKDY